jgi:DNA-binding XRE family transcriptional regulator
VKSKIQQLREQNNLTQSELAEQTTVCRRTIQRIEAGNIPKGLRCKPLPMYLKLPHKLHN